MILNIVNKTSLTAPIICKKEILRYCGCFNSTADIKSVDTLIDECLAEAEGKLVYKVCWSEVPVVINSDTINSDTLTITSESLADNLRGCSSAVVFAATTGIEIDRLIAKYSRISPAKALVFQALGAERIESLCDEFCRNLAEEKLCQNLYLKPRFSPGYGDLPLEFQKVLFGILNPSKHIGLSLNDSMLMTPSKSVTAVVGLSPTPYRDAFDKCRQCTNKEQCLYRGNR